MATASDTTLFATDAKLSVLVEGSDPNVDILIVRALDHKLAPSTWAAGNIFWPRDFLPDKFPHARILTYSFRAPTIFGLATSYNGNLPGSGVALLKSVEAERDLGKFDKRRPIIFLCEGLGGVLVQEALRSSHDNSRLTIGCTIGVIFLDPGGGPLQRSLNRFRGFPRILTEYNFFRFYYFTRGKATGSLPEKSYLVSGYCFAQPKDPDFVAITGSIATILRGKGLEVYSESQKPVPNHQVTSVHPNRERLGTLFPTREPYNPEQIVTLAAVYRNQGRWKEAGDVGAQLVDMRKENLGKDHPDTLTAMSNLAAIYGKQGRWKEAEDLGAQVMSTRKRVLGEGHPGILTAMTDLAAIYGKQKRWKEAEDLGVQAVSTSKKVLGEDHPNTLTAMANLAAIYGNQRRWKEAGDLGVQAVSTSKKVLGEDHPNTLVAMANLATVYGEQERWKEAGDLGAQVMSTRKRVLGEDHPGTLTAMANLAAIYGNQGHWKEAEGLGVQAVSTSKRVLGEDHSNTLTAMAKLATIYGKQECWKEAETLGVHAMSTSKRVLGEDHPDTLEAMDKLVIYRNQEHLEEAGNLKGKVVVMRKRVLGEDHPDTLTAMDKLATTYGSQERLEEAEDLGEDVMALGKDYPKTLTEMAVAYRNQGPWKEVEDLGFQTMSAGKDDHDTLTTIDDLPYRGYPHATSNTSAPSLPQGILKKVGDDIAKTFAGSTKVSTIVAEALGKLGPAIVDRQLSCALNEFSNNLRILSVQEDELRILWDLSDKGAFDAIAVMIREVSTLKLDHSSSKKASRPQDSCLEQILKQDELRQSQPNTPDKLFKESDKPGKHRSKEHSKHRRYCESRGEKEALDSAESDIHVSIEQLLVYLGSEKILEMFEKVVIRRLMEERKQKGYVGRIDEIRGTAEAMGDLVLEHGQKVTEVAENREDFSDQAYMSPPKGYETRTGNTIQKQRQENSSTPGGSESEDTRRKEDLSGGGWVVDQNFGTEYLGQERGEGLTMSASLLPAAVTKATPTMVTKVPGGKGKNVLAVDSVVTFGGLEGPFCAPLTPDQRREPTEDSAMEFAEVSDRMVSSTERTTGLRDPIEGGTQVEYIPPHSTEELHRTRDSIIPLNLVMDGGFSWPERFTNGKTEISFEVGDRWGLPNEAKGWIENLVREPINWWPLNPRKYPLPEDCIRVYWKCRCGKRLSSIISKERRSQYNQWIHALGNTFPSSTTQAVPVVVTLQSLPHVVTTGNNSALGDLSPLPTNNLSGAASSVPPMIPIPTRGGSTKDKWLMWCVNLGPKLTLVTNLEVSCSDNDATIFRNLRAKYWRIRGWRGWFSLYSISDIKFVKFRPYRLDHVSCYSKEELPIPNDPYYNYYDYQPRPPEEVPPVPAEQLMEYFENPSCAGTSVATLQSFPKKTNGQMSQQEKYGWGLRACEHLSFFRTITLSIVIFVGPSWFFVSWLGKHPGDLQNASVPLFLAFAFIGTFIVLPHYFN